MEHKERLREFHGSCHNIFLTIVLLDYTVFEFAKNCVCTGLSQNRGWKRTPCKVYGLYWNSGRGWRTRTRTSVNTANEMLRDLKKRTETQRRISINAPLRVLRNKPLPSHCPPRNRQYFPWTMPAWAMAIYIHDICYTLNFAIPVTMASSSLKLQNCFDIDD